jgi:hypothetical protein
MELMSIIVDDWGRRRNYLGIIKKQMEKYILNCRNERNIRRNNKSLWSSR